MSIRRLWLATYATVIFAIAACTLPNCGHAQTATRVVQVAVPVCVQIARAYVRPDIEKACVEGGDLAAVLTDLLGENASLRAKNRQSLGDAGTEGGPIHDR